MCSVLIPTMQVTGKGAPIVMVISQGEQLGGALGNEPSLNSRGWGRGSAWSTVLTTYSSTYRLSTVNVLQPCSFAYFYYNYNKNPPHNTPTKINNQFLL